MKNTDIVFLIHFNDDPTRNRKREKEGKIPALPFMFQKAIPTPKQAERGRTDFQSIGEVYPVCDLLREQDGTWKTKAIALARICLIRSLLINKIFRTSF